MRTSSTRGSRVRSRSSSRSASTSSSAAGARSKYTSQRARCEQVRQPRLESRVTTVVDSRRTTNGRREVAMSIGPEALVTDEPSAAGPVALFWERVRSDKVALVAFSFLTVVLLAAVFAGPIAHVVAPPRNAQSSDRLDPVFGTPTGPSRDFLCGVDSVGSDVFSRVLYGARVSLVVAIVGTGSAMLIGTTLGTVAGYYRGIIDTVI